MDDGRRHDYEDKILKMLRKAERTTPEEAEALQEAAAKLMLKYGYNQELIDAARIARGQAAEERLVHLKVKFDGIYSHSFLELGHAVIGAFGTMRSLQSKITKSRTILHIYGYQSDAEQAKLLVLSLQLQAIAAMSKWWKGFYDSQWLTPMEKYKERRDYIEGYGLGAASRIRNARRQVVQETGDSSGAELVLVNRKTRVESYVTGLYPELKAGRGGRRAGGIYGSHSAGYSDGTRANTGEASVGGSRRAVER